VAVVETRSQIGSGALPVSLLPSAGLALTPLAPGGGAPTGMRRGVPRGGAVEALARRLRSLPVPLIGRIEGGRVILDLRCLEDEAAFVEQLAGLVA
jgi:L-seryl-tRNA(Ser) seleniumtransferase